MALHSVGRERIENGVSKREAFKHGNVRGEWFDTWADIPRGQLPRGYWDGRTDRRVFVVFSYATPIAVWDQDWSMPDERYSATTNNHQAVVRGAIRATGQTAWVTTVSA